MNIRNRFLNITVVFILSLVMIISPAQAQRISLTDTQDEPQYQPTGSETIKYLSQIGGSLSAVVIDGNLAYVGVGSLFQIIDISDQQNIILLGELRLDATINTMAQIGSYVYVGTNQALRIIDVSDPQNPIQVKSHGESWYFTSTRDITISGNRAYACVYTRLYIIDITNPEAPSDIGYESLPAMGFGVAVSGDYAYVAAIYKGLRIIDVSDPSNPTEVGAYSQDAGIGPANDVVVNGIYAYVAAGGHGLRVIDVSDPQNPMQVKRMTGYGNQIVYQNHHVFLASDDWLWIFDVSTPTDPQNKSMTSIPSDGYLQDLTLVNTTLYAANGGPGLHIFDVSNVISPASLGEYDPEGYPARGVAFQNGFAYIVDGHGFWVTDLQNPLSPSVAAQVDTPGYSDNVVISDTLAYVADGSGGLRIFDIANPYMPTEIGFYDPDGGYITDLKIKDGVAYLADSWTGLRIVDVNDPTNPTEVGLYDAVDYPRGLAVVSSTVYLADYNTGLQIIDISNLAVPVELGTYDTPGSAPNVVVRGNLAYVADGWKGLRIIDVTDPNNLIEIGAYEPTSPGGVSDIDLLGDVAFTSKGNGGIRMLDISDPAHPTSITEYDTAGSVERTHIVGNYAYLADGFNGLVIAWLELPATNKIDPTGGILTSTTGDTVLSFGAGIFSQAVNVTHTPISPGEVPEVGELIAIGHTFVVTATAADTSRLSIIPNASYTITVAYQPYERGIATRESIALYAWNGDTWSQEGITSSVNIIDNLVTAQVDDFSLFAVLGETRRVYLPLVLKSR